MNEYKIRNGIAVLLSISGIAGSTGSVFTISIAILADYNFVLYTSIALYIILIVLIPANRMIPQQP